MNGSNNPQRNKRLAMLVSGAMDAVLGAVIVLIGLGFFPVNIDEYGFPQWIVLLVGGVMFTLGAWLAIYNYSRLDE
jgi:ABC-type branched-subunit amino acid transport system permease subunit